MTADECWAEIAKCTRACNWGGVVEQSLRLVELGEVEAARTLAWAVKTGSVPESASHTFRGWPPHPDEDHRVWWRFVLKGADGTVERSWDTERGYSWSGTPDAEIVKGWKWVADERAKIARYYEAEL